jgi:hypothetical protein
MDATLGSNEHPQAEATIEAKLLPAKVTEIIGYVEPWIASPGAKVDVKVCAEIVLANISPSMPISQGHFHQLTIFLKFRYPAQAQSTNIDSFV